MCVCIVMYVYVDCVYCVCVYTCILTVYVPRILYLLFIFEYNYIYFTKILCSSRIFVSTGLGAAEQIADIYRCHLEDKTGRMPDWVVRDQFLNDIT
jgi:hypothetical protein